MKYILSSVLCLGIAGISLATVVEEETYSRTVRTTPGYLRPVVVPGCGGRITPLERRQARRAAAANAAGTRAEYRRAARLGTVIGSVPEGVTEEVIEEKVEIKEEIKRKD